MNKIKLNDLKVKSFVTSLESGSQKTLKGGFAVNITKGGCLTQTSPTHYCPTYNGCITISVDTGN